MNNDKSIEKKLKKYNKKLSKRKERWKYIEVNGEKTHMAISSFGNLFNFKNGKLHDFSNCDKRNYRRFSFKFNGVDVKFDVHRCVAMYFCKIPKRHREKGLTYKDLEVNHKNGIKWCNASFNLEWVTPKENTDHAWKTGLCDGIRGEKAHLAKITEEEAIQICEYIMQKKNNKEISELMNVSEKTIQHIRSKECWKHIACNYKFPKLNDNTPYTIPVDTIHEVCKLLEKKKFTDAEIAKLLDLNRRTVCDIRTRRRRKDISQNYNF